MGLLLEDQPWGTVVDESFTTHQPIDTYIHHIEKIKNNSYSGASLSQDFDGDCDIKDSFDNFLMTTMNPLSDKYDPQGRE